MRSLLALADLIVDPSRINDLTPDEARAILAQLATLQAPLLAKALATPVAEEKDSANALLLVPDAAARLGIEASYLYELIRQGRVPAVRLGPKYALGSTYSPRRDRRRAAPHPKAPRAHAGSAG